MIEKIIMVAGGILLFGSYFVYRNKEAKLAKEEIEDSSIENRDELLLLSRQEVADIFRITLPTLSDWEKRGVIPKAIRMGRRVYYQKYEIINHINASKGSSDEKLN